MLHRKCLGTLSDRVLLRDLAALLARERENAAAILLHLAEVEVRRLYVPEGYDSLRAYCVRVLHMSDDEAGRRIHVANKSRLVPALLDAIAEGRLHLTGASLRAYCASRPLCDASPGSPPATTPRSAGRGVQRAGPGCREPGFADSRRRCRG